MLARSMQYIQGLRVYHKKLENVLRQNYQIDTKYLEVISWGYQTTAMYIKSDDDKEYLLKLANWNDAKEKAIIKDIDLSNMLRNVVSTPVYIKTLSDSYTCRFEDKILRLSHYISGLAPLEMNFDILEQMIDMLKKIHAFPASRGEVSAAIRGSRERRGGDPRRECCRNLRQASGCPTLLHGDLTPHNVLVSFGKIVAVMDFEISFVGPREWDLARTAFFSWNYMKNTPFDKVARFVLEKYAEGFINPDLFYKHAVENAQKHLDAVEKHRDDYDKQKNWEKDHDFALRQLQGLVLLKS